MRLRELIQQAEAMRFCRAVAGLLDGYTVTITRREKEVLLAEVSFGDKTYTAGVNAAGHVQCTCPDWQRRSQNGDASPCKHVLMLVLKVCADSARKGGAQNGESRGSVPRRDRRSA